MPGSVEGHAVAVDLDGPNEIGRESASPGARVLVTYRDAVAACSVIDDRPDYQNSTVADHAIQGESVYVATPATSNVDLAFGS